MAFLSGDEEEDYCIIDKEEEEDYCIIIKKDYQLENDEERDDHDGVKQQPNKVTRQFYFVKFNPLFIDPALEQRIDRLKLLKQRLNMERRALRSLIKSLENKMNQSMEQGCRRGYECRFRCWSYSQYSSEWTINDLRGRIAKYWPEIVNEDPEEALNPELEDARIDKRVEELKHQLNHGNHRIGDQTRLLRELKRKQHEKEQLEHQVQAGEVRAPSMYDKRGPWITLSKYKTQQYLATCLRGKRERKKCQEKENVPIRNEISKAQEKLRFIDQKKARVHNRILMAQNEVDEQAAYYQEFITIMQNAKELAAKKDLAALEELSHKQMEKFEQRWKSSAKFRANYKRSADYYNMLSIAQALGSMYSKSLR